MSIHNVACDYSIPGCLRLKIKGDWTISSSCPSAEEVILMMDLGKGIKSIKLDLPSDFKWDSVFVAFLLGIDRYLCANAKEVRLDLGNVPDGAGKLLALALRVENKEASRPDVPVSFLENAAEKAIAAKRSIFSLLDFLGEIAFSFWRLLRGKAYFRMDEFVSLMRKCGLSALPLVSLISLLVGMILAFVGSIQLQMFGAQIFIADIVGIAMVRVMGAVMTGVLMSGRTGASFAAELGIMQMNEEIDAFKTFGVPPVEFLVLPRLLAMVIMMPLLTIYADLMGIAGGVIVSSGMMDINPIEYLNRTQEAVKLANVWIGLCHSLVFAVIISVAGCLRGMNCRRNSSAVGEATTSAVVVSVTGIVIATAVITLICQILGV